MRGECTRATIPTKLPLIDNPKSKIQNRNMCRSIKKLRNNEVPATPEEVQAAALQFVRKVSGYRVPAKKNEAAFAAAVEAVTFATSALLSDMDAPNQVSPSQSGSLSA
jgi:hypothetical protein